MKRVRRYTPTYHTWRAMKYRAQQSHHEKDTKYRAMGMCEEWKVFLNFYRDMGERPDGLTIERIDNLKGYSKENCKWGTKSEQNINKSHWKKPNKYGYTGIKFHRVGSGGKHFMAMCRGKYVGYFLTIKEAALAYDQKAKELYGNKALLNFPEEEYGDRI